MSTLREEIEKLAEHHERQFINEDRRAQRRAEKGLPNNLKTLAAGFHLRAAQSLRRALAESEELPR